MQAQSPAPRVVAALLEQGRAADAVVAIHGWADQRGIDANLGNLYGVARLMVGDMAGAREAFTKTLMIEADSPMAWYGLGLEALNRRDAAAADCFRKAAVRGDRARCLLAERYAELMTGARGVPDLPLPNDLRQQGLALRAVALVQQGRPSEAQPLLERALAGLVGEPFDERDGLLMSFDMARPLRPFRPKRISAGYTVDSLWTAAPQPSSGFVEMRPKANPDAGGFVAYKVDGQTLCVSNSAPSVYQWDCRTAWNGIHTLEVGLYDARGAEGSVWRGRVLVANRQPLASPLAQEWRHALDGAWRHVTLQVGRAALNLAAYEAARAAGDVASARRYVETVAAINPDDPRVRSWLQSQMRTPSQGPIWRVKTDAPVVAITFDDGPAPGITERLLQSLQSQGARATFFVIGRHVAARPELVRRLQEAGMQVENHSYSHPNVSRLGRLDVEREMLRTNAAIRMATGGRPRYFRPPGGNLSPEVTAVAEAWGMVPCMWSVNGEKLERTDPLGLARYIVDRSGPGSIILLHNGRQSTVDALPAILKGLRTRGFSMVTVDEMVGRYGAARR
ncbi:MAG: polysaccharide deacetylase family protein [Armatimonadetes bacterium]|nr:polysaccharide deacetylase family protein [Armatimonadota bacterium]